MKERFEAKEGVVIDNNTGLMWMQNPMEGEFTFDEACELKHKFTGYDDWRLPSIVELSSIINLNKRPCIFEEFLYLGKRIFWSNTGYRGLPSAGGRSNCNFLNFVELVDFRLGCICYSKNSYEYSVRLVRG